MATGRPLDLSGLLLEVLCEIIQNINNIDNDHIKSKDSNNTKSAKLTHSFHLRFDGIPFAPNKFIINLWIYFKSHGINRIWGKGVREEANSLRESVTK